MERLQAIVHWEEFRYELITRANFASSHTRRARLIANVVMHVITVVQKSVGFKFVNEPRS